MNDKLRQLAEQAETKEIGYYFFDKEKFAELIVRQCAIICKDIAEKQFSPLYTRESDGAAVCYKKIKEHFGVE